MGDVKRLYPEPKTALINWIEQNFVGIKGYAATFELEDGTTMTIHNVQTPVQAAGLGAITDNAMKRVVDEWQS